MTLAVLADTRVAAMGSKSSQQVLLLHKGHSAARPPAGMVSSCTSKSPLAPGIVVIKIGLAASGADLVGAPSSCSSSTAGEAFSCCERRAGSRSSSPLGPSALQLGSRVGPTVSEAAAAAPSA